MKKIFSTLIFFCALILTTTVFAEDTIKAATDDSDNGWYIYPSSIKVVKNGDGVLYFYTNAAIIFSERGRNETINFFRSRGVNPKGLDKLLACMQRIYFLKKDGNIYSSTTDMIFYDADKKRIPEMGYTGAPLEWEIVNNGEIHEAVYNAAILYVQALL